MAFYEKLTSVTALRRRTYNCYEIQRASRVGGNRHLERIIKGADAIAAGAVSQTLDEGVDISQSTVPVFEESVGITFTVDELNFTGIGRSVDQGGQETDGNGKSASSEDHCVERRVKASHWLPLDTQWFIYPTPGRGRWR